MYKFKDATQADLERLRDWLDRHRELSYHVEADLEWWMTGHWKLEGEPVEFTDMEDMLSHLEIFQ